MPSVFGIYIYFELSNATLTSIMGQQAKKPDLLITANRDDLETAMGGQVTFDDLIKAGKAKSNGDRKSTTPSHLHFHHIFVHPSHFDSTAHRF